jgi:exopolysaccharide production protein ExoY
MAGVLDVEEIEPWTGSNFMSVASLPETDTDTLLAIDRNPRYERRDFQVLKRLFDVVVSAVLLLSLFPLFVVVALLILCLDGAPVIYKQRRVGRGGAHFWMYKFRTMRRDAEEILQRDPVLLAEYQRNFKLENDPRLLKCGKLLRTLTIDELPQLVNVFQGHMSLVGPRPLIPSESCRYGSAFSVYCRMKPGCAGLWQHRGRNALSFEERVSNDVEYYQTASLRRDLLVIARTARAILVRRGAM